MTAALPHGMTINDLLAFHRDTFGSARMEDPPADGGDGGNNQPPPPQTFSQADVDRIVADRLKRERDKYADYDALKATAGQLPDVEKRATTAEAEALRSKVALTHGISLEDRDLFLTGADEESLTAQAKRLAERDAARKQQGPIVPGEGNNFQPKPDEMREFARGLFGRATAD